MTTTFMNILVTLCLILFPFTTVASCILPDGIALFGRSGLQSFTPGSACHNPPGEKRCSCDVAGSVAITSAHTGNVYQIVADASGSTVIYNVTSRVTIVGAKLNVPRSYAAITYMPIEHKIVVCGGVS